MLKTDNIKTITDIRQNALKLLNFVQESQDPVFILQHSKPKGVFLSFAKYQHLMSLVEDYLDIIEAESTLDDPTTKFTPLDKFWQQHQLAS